jgi:N-acetylglucosamine-6-phosphate deacetylase
MIRIAIQAMGIGLPEAVAMASAVPAKAAGLDDVGRIAPGNHADLALFTEDLTVKAVALAGRWHHSNTSSIINTFSGKEPLR